MNMAKERKEEKYICHGDVRISEEQALAVVQGNLKGT